ncbi:hypothetical protein OG21DRAFT_1508202 [Imleria badia]|nr:hypothetical protein OG21DRAFT_1508202 [Imleria badia]
MRASSSLISFGLYLSLAAAAVIPNAVDITSRDNGDSTGTGVVDALLGNTGKVSGSIWGGVVPSALVGPSITAAGGSVASPENGGSTAKSVSDDVLANAGGVLGTIWGGVVPSALVGPSITSAGGSLPDEN